MGGAPRSTFRLDKPLETQLNKPESRLNETQRLTSAFTRPRYWTLSQVMRIQSTPQPCYLKFNLNHVLMFTIIFFFPGLSHNRGVPRHCVLRIVQHCLTPFHVKRW
jgi:hypothetical protein